MINLKKKFLIKTLCLSTILVIIFNIGGNFINANGEKNLESKKTYSKTSNKNSFSSSDNYKLGKTGVAITTNLGTRTSEKKNLSSTIYKEVFSISEIIGDEQKAKQELIGKNMLILQDYRNVLKIDFKKLIKSSKNKSQTLEAYTEQLEYRFTNAAQNINTLTKQREAFLGDMSIANEKIENLKNKITSDFKNNDSEQSLKNIDEYLELKKEFYYARTYTIYINHFLSEYSYLNEYTKLLLDTIINNKDAIIKDSYIVLPDSGNAGLRQLDLIYTEEEFKSN